MRITIAFAFLVAVLPIVLAGCFSNRLDDGMKGFKGNWIVFELTENGKQADPQTIKRSNLDFTKGKLQKTEILDTHIVKAEEYSVRVDNSKNPAEIDFVCTQGDGQGKTRHGIFVFEDGKLKICSAELDAARPTSFVAGPKWTLMVLGRKK